MASLCSPYPDKIIITYNFTDIIDSVKITPENTAEIEKQSESAYSLSLSSCLLPQSAPNKKASILKRNSGTKIAYQYAVKKKKQIINLFEE